METKQHLEDASLALTLSVNSALTTPPLVQKIRKARALVEEAILMVVRNSDPLNAVTAFIEKHR